MDEEKLASMARDPRYISGIHNYCDRWCERCPLASRCMVFAIESASANDPGAQEPPDAAYWEELEQTFELTKQMLTRKMQEMGIELSDSDMREAGRREAHRRRKARSQEPTRLGMKYAKLVDGFFDGAPTMLEEKQHHLQTIADLRIAGQDPEADATEITDAVEVIRFYQYFIYVKTARALSGLADVQEDPGEDPEVGLSDANGSAKVALLAIDRCIGAWRCMGRHFPDKADDTLDLLGPLDRLRRHLEKAFPEARAFHRPGFDDENVMRAASAAED